MTTSGKNARRAETRKNSQGRARAGAKKSCSITAMHAHHTHARAPAHTIQYAGDGHIGLRHSVAAAAGYGACLCHGCV